MLVQCGATGCKRVFEASGTSVPVIYICPECEEKMNRGIQVFLHTYTDRPYGNLNLMEKFDGTLRIH